MPPPGFRSHADMSTPSHGSRHGHAQSAPLRETPCHAHDFDYAAPTSVASRFVCRRCASHKSRRVCCDMLRQPQRVAMFCRAAFAPSAAAPSWFRRAYAPQPLPGNIRRYAKIAGESLAAPPAQSQLPQATLISLFAFSPPDTPLCLRLCHRLHNT